ALLCEVLLLLEVFLLVVLITYTFVTSDFLPLALYVVLITAVITLQVLTDPKRRENLLAPGAWVTIYLVDAVELQALVRSLWRFSRGQGLQWQRWQRTGVFTAVPRRALPEDEVSLTGPR